jgi:hypothetical protein
MISVSLYGFDIFIVRCLAITSFYRANPNCRSDAIILPPSAWNPQSVCINQPQTCPPFRLQILG